MASRGDNGDKRKYDDESGEERGTNKRIHGTSTFSELKPSSSTFSETKQNEQVTLCDCNIKAQEDKNWMRYIETDHEDVPKCAPCNKVFCFETDPPPFKINPAHFKEHLKNTHPERYHKMKSIINEIQNSSDWIFFCYNFVKHKQHLKCTQCELPIEVEFQGPLVDHYLVHHKETAKQDDTGESSQRSHKDTEITAKLIQYLFLQHMIDVDKTSFKTNLDKTKEKTWSRKHWNINIENYQKNLIKCGLCAKFFSVVLKASNYKAHINSGHKKEAQSLSNNKKWLTEHFLFRANVMWCTICKKSFSLHITDNLTQHLEKEHNLRKDNELIQTDDPNIDRLLSRFINNLIDKHEDKSEERAGNEPTQAV